MIEILKDVLIDSLIDTIKLLPFLFITYLIMEYIEHKMTEKSKTAIQKAGKMGPLFGGLVGVIPQCGFSASATNLYAARVISLGTLIAVYLSTSDEMLPILISEAVPMSTILKVLMIKLIIGIIVGFIIDFVLRIIKKGNKETEIEHEHIDELCDHEHCHCEEEGILKSAVKHTIHIFNYTCNRIISRNSWGREYSLICWNTYCTWTCNIKFTWTNSKLCSICYNN